MFGNDHIRPFSEKTLLEAAIEGILHNRCSFISRIEQFCCSKRLL